MAASFPGRPFFCLQNIAIRSSVNASTRPWKTGSATRVWGTRMNQRAYTLELLQLASAVPSGNRQAFMTAFQASEKNPVVLFGFNIFLGALGVDRFLVGDILAGVLKLLTLGGLGLWQLIDCFLIGSRARNKNLELARQLANSFSRTAQPGADESTATSS
jgi:TM2 domain-containing membrane protein YozV